MQAICCVLIASFLVSLCTNVVFAVTCADYTGHEDAEDSSQFNSEYDQNVYKIWSVCKSYGMSDNQACAVLANIAGEGSCRPWVVEGCSNVSLASECGYTPGGEYNEEIPQYFMEHRADYVSRMLKKVYNVPDDKITRARNGESGIVHPLPGSGKNMNVSAYFNHGEGSCGIGIVQWTCERCDSLMNFAEENSTAWWYMETQLTFIFIEPGWETVWNTYMQDYQNASVEDCVHYLVYNYEIPADKEGACNTRNTYANQFLEKLAGKGWDSRYGSNIISGAGLIPIKLHTGIYDVGMVESYATPAIYYPTSAGYLTINKKDELDANNQSVYHGYVNSLFGEDDTSPTYSLFELYGEDLHWYRYLGEATLAPGLIDHIYSAWDQDKIDDLVSLKTIFYSPSNYLSTQVYPGRPECLSGDDIHDGYTDPRVSAQTWARFSGFFYVSGSFSMTIAKHIVSCISLLLGEEILFTAKDILNDVETSDNWISFMPVIWILIALGVIALIASLVKKIAKYARGIEGSPQDIVLRFCISFMCIGFIICSMYNPTVFNELAVNAACAVDRIFNSALADAVSGDEVIAVQNDTLATRAVIWKTAIFEPWCRGQFGYEYEDLYTNYANLSAYQDEDGNINVSAYPQSNAHAGDTDADGNPLYNSDNPFYNSTELTGDVFVPVGGGKKIRNWAALLYSCGTEYHIDCTMTDNSKIQDKNADAAFPIANSTAYNSRLYADMFRIVDAQYDISPQYYPEGETRVNYTGARQLSNSFGTEGFNMLVNAALLLFLVPAIYERLKNFIIILVTVLQMIYFSFIELFKENTGIKNFGATLKKAAAGYFIAAIKIYIMVILYMTFVDKGFIMAFIYALLCITVLGLSLNDISRFTKKTFNRAKHAINRIRAKKTANA